MTYNVFGWKLNPTQPNHTLRGRCSHLSVSDCFVLRIM